MSRTTLLKPRGWHKPATIFASFVLLAAVSAVVLSRSLSPAAEGAPASAPPPPPRAAALQGGKERRAVESELITVTPRGFEPAEVTRPAGEFILVVENRSGLSADLRLSRETGEHLREIRSSGDEPDWSGLENLPPGTYVLTEAEHPEWVCRINITAR